MVRIASFPSHFHQTDHEVAHAMREQKPDPYPSEELEWLTTTTFNRAVDYYCASQDVDSRRWAEKALAIAKLSDDDGALHSLLQEKYMGLKWEPR